MKNKYLWIFPTRNLNDLSNKWTFYGTQTEYVTWLRDMPVEEDRIKQILRMAAKFSRA
jgi:hypothetical protein